MKKDVKEDNNNLNSNEYKTSSLNVTPANGSKCVNRWCNNKEEDTDTSSSGSTSIENVHNCLVNSTVKKDTSPAGLVVADLLASLNGAVGKDAGIQYLKAIQNYPASKLLNVSPTAKSTSPPKSSPSVTPHRLPQRANDNDVCESPLSSLVPHDRTFAHVPGRLSLLSNVVKYKVNLFKCVKFNFCLNFVNLDDCW